MCFGELKPLSYTVAQATWFASNSTRTGAGCVSCVRSPEASGLFSSGLSHCIYLPIGKLQVPPLVTDNGAGLTEPWLRSENDMANQYCIQIYCTMHVHWRRLCSSSSVWHASEVCMAYGRQNNSLKYTYVCCDPHLVRLVSDISSML